MKNINIHQKEYSQSLSIVNKKINRGTGRDHPSSFSYFMRESVKECEKYKDFYRKLGASNRARNAHDFYGWMSKDGKLGGCRGAIYRSETYMQIPLADRSGRKKFASKGEEYSTNDVHIEHSIPVAVILETIWHELKGIFSESNNQLELKKLHENFLSLSVCTALTREEEKFCVKKVFSKKHPQFDRGKVLVNSLEEILPFLRYDFSKGLKIFEAINGKEVDPETFSLKNHIELLSEVGLFSLPE